MKTLEHMPRGLCFAALLLGTAGACAQTYPVKPIRLIVAYPAGGSNDPSARTVGQHLAIADYALPQRRLMYRTTVKGQAPH